MNIRKNKYYLLIIMGCAVAVYANANEEQNTTVLVLGIIILMLGLYGISKNIPSKSDNENEEREDDSV